jgi:hypothetical protein
MNKHEKRLYEALAKIAGVASAAVNGDAFPDVRMMSPQCRRTPHQWVNSCARLKPSLRDC